MEEKIGVFICTGYGIAEAISVDDLCEVVTGECNVPFCQTVESCEGTGLNTIIKEIKNNGLDRVVIGGISARAYGAGSFPKDVIVERVPLREHVVWCQPISDDDDDDDKENRQALAGDYMRMYIAKVRTMEPPEPFQAGEPIDKTILVVGGGVTGMTAAQEAANAGYDVHLVEKTAALGGWLARQHKSVPLRAPFRDLEDTGIKELVADINDSPRITVHTSAKTSAINGAPGLFDVTLESTDNGKPEGEALASFRVGAVLQATGWSPTEPRDNLAYGKLPDVIRNVDLEEMVVSKGRITRPSDGEEVKSIAFIQCGGSRDKEHHSYCSSICCLTALKQARYLREQDSDAKAYIFYEFFRTPGHYEEFYRATQEDPGIFLTRGDVAGVERDQDGGLIVTAERTMQGSEIEVKVDLVVLAAGMKPNSADGEAIRALEEATVKMETGESDVIRDRATEEVERLKHHEGTQILNLTYRQGPDLPTLEHGFPDSHFICFPYESQRTGIYTAGCARQPMDSLGSREDATGAALKAIQCVEMTSRGEAVHPRSGDMSYPEFYMQRCTQCKRCTEECPFGAINEDEKANPLPEVTRCRRCGTCLGACPERIISFKDYSVEIINSMIKAVEMPDEFEEKPRVLALLCENDAYPALEVAAEHRIKLNPFVRVIPVRCLGSVNLAWIKEAISCGYDGVLLVGCKYGDDYQCHYVKGSELLATRSDNIRETMEKMSMESERIEMFQLQISEYQQLADIFNNFSEVIEKYGMNPFKEM